MRARTSRCASSKSHRAHWGSAVVHALGVLVENALKHNIVSAQHPLHITLENEEDLLVIKNTYQPKKPQLPPPKKGLANLIQRLELLGVRRFEIAIDKKDFIVRFSLIRPES